MTVSLAANGDVVFAVSAGDAGGDVEVARYPIEGVNPQTASSGIAKCIRRIVEGPAPGWQWSSRS